MEVVLVMFVCLVTLAVLCLLCWGYRAYNRRHENKQYDERQQKARLEASQVSNIFTYVYFFGVFVYLSAGYFNQTDTFPAFLLVSYGLLMKLVSYHIYCIFSHAALPLGERPSAMIIFYGGLAFLQAWKFADHVRLGHLHTAGTLYVIDYLLGAIGFGFLAILYLISMLRKEKE